MKKVMKKKIKIRTNLECPAHEYCAAWGLKLVSDVRVVNGSYEFWVEVAEGIGQGAW